VYFSNRSACHAGLKDWQQAIQDAKECIRLDPSFVKGYYRLAIALKELKDYPTALSAIRQGLAAAGETSNSNSDPLHKLLRQVEQLQRNVEMNNDSPPSSTSVSAYNNTSGSRPHSAPLDDAATRELEDLRQLSAQTSRDLQIAQANLQKINRDKRMAEITKGELASLPEQTPCYRAIGKIFVKSSQERVTEYLDQEVQGYSKRMVDLTQKKEYLERRFKSQQQNMKDILSPAE
jgi:chaperonin cofactor prefoldin